jgi:hypothetical protein
MVQLLKSYRIKCGWKLVMNDVKVRILKAVTALHYPDIHVEGQKNHQIPQSV